MNMIGDEGLIILGVKRVKEQQGLFDAVEALCCSLNNAGLVQKAQEIALYIEGRPSLTDIQAVTEVIENTANEDSVVRFNTFFNEELEDKEYIISMAVYV